MRTLAHFQVSEISPGLFQGFIDGYINFLRLPPLLAEQQVPNKGTSTHLFPNRWLWLRIPSQAHSSSNPMDSQFSILALWNLCSESVRAWNLEIIVEDFRHWRPECDYHSDRMLICISIQLCKLCWLFYLYLILSIFFMRVLYFRPVRGGAVVQNVLYWGSWNRRKFMSIDSVKILKGEGSIQLCSLYGSGVHQGPGEGRWV